MQFIIGVLNCVISEKKILLLKRAKEPYIGFWVLPGGKIEFGEQIEEAALRELKKETGLDAEFLGIRGILNEIVFDSENNKKLHFLMFFCELKPLHKKIVESNEGALKWFDISKLEKSADKVFPSDIAMIKEFILGKKRTIPVHKSRIRQNGTEYEMEFFKSNP